MFPMAETIYQSSQTVMEGYHIPIMSVPNQCSPLLMGHCIIGGGDRVLLVEAGHLPTQRDFTQTC